MLAFRKYATTITLVCFSVFCKSEHKAYGFSGHIDNIIESCYASSYKNSPPATTVSEVTPSPSSNDIDPAVENKQIVSVGELLKFEGGIGVKVSVDLRDDEYNLKIKRIKFSSPSDLKEEMERSEQTASSAGMLLLQAEMLREMGDQLLAQYRASFRSTITN